MSDTSILPAGRDYFQALSESRPIAEFIAAELEWLTLPGAKALRQCGRYGIGSDPIELVSGAHGLFARGVKWCGSRYCPICQPRMMAVLGAERAKRAHAAERLGLGVAFVQFGQPHGVQGELEPLLNAQREDWKRSFRAPSRLPAAWRAAGLDDWLGLDYSTEPDWEGTAENWHVHTHALAFRRRPWCADSLAFLRDCWPHTAPLAWAEQAENPGGAARYVVKAENEKPHILGLFDLARLGLNEQIAEYLQAVQGRRLRAPSRALSDALGLRSASEDEADLMAAVERAPGEVVERLTVREWRRLW